MVLVHGFNSGPQTWEYVLERIKQDQSLGRVRVLPFEYATGVVLNPLKMLREVFPSIGTAADSLGEYLRTEGGPFEGLVIITHSMGGLVVQRYLARMLADGRGGELARIHRVVMLACPNDGSQLLLSLRRGILGRRGRNPQERELRPLDEQVTETRRVIVNQVLGASAVTDRTYPVPFFVYAGESDTVVPVSSARSVFRDAAALPGDHFSILKATTPEHRTFTTLRRHLHEDGAASGGRPAGTVREGPVGPAGAAGVVRPRQVGVIPPRGAFQDRAERAREKQRQAEDLATQRQAHIDQLTDKLDRLHVGAPEDAAFASSSIHSPHRRTAQADPLGDDIDQALARAAEVNDHGADLLQRITDDLDPEDDGPTTAVQDKYPDNVRSNDNTRDYFSEPLLQALLNMAKKGKAQCEARDFAGAAATYNELVYGLEVMEGPDHPNTLHYRTTLGYLQYLSGDPVRAVATLTELLPRLERVKGSHDRDTFKRTRRSDRRSRGSRWGCGYGCYGLYRATGRPAESIRPRPPRDSCLRTRCGVLAGDRQPRRLTQPSASWRPFPALRRRTDELAPPQRRKGTGWSPVRLPDVRRLQQYKQGPGPCRSVSSAAPSPAVLVADAGYQPAAGAARDRAGSGCVPYGFPTSTGWHLPTGTSASPSTPDSASASSPASAGSSASASPTHPTGRPSASTTSSAHGCR
ncbi:alpha/beta fold hydrolase [Streptomyces sp. NPDC001852]|uniref:alpha/beta fold hydrolase n=1 Tax=Streptomyces sp. NPDC001852 TaxID=3364619 RepID=UPI0036ACB2E5